LEALNRGGGIGGEVQQVSKKPMGVRGVLNAWRARTHPGQLNFGSPKGRVGGEGGRKRKLICFRWSCPKGKVQLT